MFPPWLTSHPLRRGEATCSPSRVAQSHPPVPDATPRALSVERSYWIFPAGSDLQPQAFLPRSRSGFHTFSISWAPDPPLKSLPAQKLCSPKIRSPPCGPQTSGSLPLSFPERPPLLPPGTLGTRKGHILGTQLDKSVLDDTALWKDGSPTGAAMCWRGRHVADNRAGFKPQPRLSLSSEA